MEPKTPSKMADVGMTSATTSTSSLTDLCELDIANSPTVQETNSEIEYLFSDGMDERVGPVECLWCMLGTVAYFGIIFFYIWAATQLYRYIGDDNALAWWNFQEY